MNDNLQELLNGDEYKTLTDLLSESISKPREEYKPPTIYVSAEDFDKAHLEKERAKAEKEFVEMKNLEEQVFSKGGSMRNFTRKMAKKLKNPTFSEMLKGYYSEINKLKLGGS